MVSTQWSLCSIENSNTETQRGKWVKNLTLRNDKTSQDTLVRTPCTHILAPHLLLISLLAAKSDSTFITL